MERTIRIPQGLGTRLTAEIVVSRPCSECGHEQTRQELAAHYRRLGEEAAKALYSGTPGGFWQAIQQFAIEQALVDGTIVRPSTRAY